MKALTSYLTLFIFLILFSGNQSALAVEAVASVKNIMGAVEVQRKDFTLTARTGLILHDMDLVVTHDKARITIEFRDGSLIRLFPNTKFLIEKSEEAPSGPRSFLHNFRLKIGSFWGKFTKRQQETVIKTPTATVGIKGTTVVLSERNNKLDVSLSTGKVQIKNLTDSVELEAGHVAQKVSKQGSISDKIVMLPYQLEIKPDQNQVTVPELGEELELYFTLQLVDVRTRHNAERSGEVYISHTADHIKFDQNIQLNSRGYARVKAVIKAPEKTSYNLDKVEIFALMDGEEYLDVRAGNTVLLLTYPDSNNQRLKIDASSGEVK